MASTGNKRKTTSSKSASGSTKRTGQGKKSASKSRNTSARSSSRNTAGRNTQRSNGKTSAKRNDHRAAQREFIDYALYLEVILWVILALSVLLFISYFGVGGKAGSVISGCVFGLFGAMAYVFPFFLFFMTAFMISNSRSRIARIKASASIVLFLVLCGAMQLILIGYNKGYSLTEYYESGMLYHTGGGFFGGIIASVFCPAIGVIGTVILLIFLTIICAILITQHSFMSGVKKSSAAMKRRAVMNRDARRENARRWQDERRRYEEEYEEPIPPRKVSVTALPDDLPVRRKTRPVPVLPVTLDSVDAKHKMSHVSAASTEKMQDKNITSDLNFLSADDDQDTGSVSGIPVDPEPAAMKDLRNAAKKRTKSKAAVIDLSAENTSGSDAVKNMPVREIRLDHAMIGDQEKKETDHGEQTVSPAVSAGKSADIPDWLKSAEGMIADDEDEDDMQSEAESASDILNRSDRETEEMKDASAPAAVTPEAGQASGTKERSSGRKPRSSQEEIEAGVENVEREIEKIESIPVPEYVFPTTDLMKKPSGGKGKTTKDELVSTAEKLQQVFDTFGVNVHITNVTCGPSVTRYELMPEMGVKVSKILGLQDDIKLNLAAEDIRIEAPIPGKAAVGIEVPNKEKSGVLLRELLESEEFKNHPSKLCYAVGKDIGGNIIVSDIARMPHLLVAGATGSGKSVFINTLIMSILYKAKPDEVKLIMVDPKVVELSVYNSIPHLLIPVVTDPKKAAGALNWAVAEMMRRYEKFAETGVRDLKGYNKRVEMQGDDIPEDQRAEKMPQIVIIIDELADLMMVASAEVEDAICRLAQLARAAGIHLVIATQRPSVDVITGLIKANMPSRIAFSVSSGVDSRTILDTVGAEKLLGNGDMLFAPQTFKQPLRVQGAFIDDTEVANVVDYIKDHNGGEQLGSIMAIKMAEVEHSISSTSVNSDTDELFAQAGKFIIEKDKASIGMLQRWFKIGFNRAARIMDQLSEAGVVGPEEGTKPRKVLMSEEQFENYLEQN